MLKIMEENRRR